MRRLLFITCLSIFTQTCLAQNAVENPLFNTFKPATIQGEGNAPIVAVVKAAIGTFGVNNVFRYVSAEAVSEKYTVRLRNDETITLKFHELKEAGAFAKFNDKNTDLLSADIKKYAQFCFAVMAKKLQLRNPQSTYASAISAINKGFDLAEAASLLGLRLKSLKPCTVDNLSHYNHIIIQNYYYTAYANTGYYDETSNQAGVASLDAFRQNHYGSKCALRRCNITAAYRVDE